MARSPFLRLATSATRTLAEAAFDRGRDAVLVVDMRAKHLPIVLANQAARDCLISRDSADLLDSSLFGFLGAASASVIEAATASLSNPEPVINRLLAWRRTGREIVYSTELKLLDSPQNQRLVMFTFTPVTDLAVGSAVDQLPVDLLILDRDLNVTYANAGALRASGAEGNIIGRSALTLNPTSSLHREIYEHALDGQSHSRGLRVPGPAGAQRHLLMEVQPLRGAAGIDGLIVLSGDMHEGVLKAARGESERYLQSLIEASMDIIAIAAWDGTLVCASRGAHAVHGYPVIRQNPPTIFDFLHPSDAAALRTKFLEFAAGETHAFTQQQRVRRQDGTYCWLESHYVAAFNNPLINGVTVSSHNIDDRKHAESQLAQREEVFRLAAEAVDGIIFEWDLVQGVVYRSRGVREILGIEPEDLAPVIDAWRERVHPRDLDAANRQIGLALIQGRGWATSYRVRDARGRYRSMLERALIQRNAQGDPVRAIGCSVDVSEIKRLTDLLAEAQSTAQMGVWEYSYTTLDLAWTEEMFRIYETTPGEFVPSWDAALAQYTPESTQRFHEAWRRAESGNGAFDMEAEITTLKGRRIWVRVIAHFEMLDGRPVRSYGSVQNIHDQKLAHLALETSTDWLKLSMQMAHMHAWRWDKASDALEFAVVDQQHLPTMPLKMAEFMTRVHPRDRMPLSRAIEESMRTRTELQTEFRFLTKTERYRSLATIGRPLIDAAGAVVGYVGVTQDVTARREAETKLRRSEQLLRATTANTADTLLLVDTDLRVRFINRGDGNLRVEEIVGREIAEILPEAARGVVVAKLRHVLNTGETAIYTYESRDVSRDPQYFESRAVLVHDDGIGTALSISVTDITERKRLEQEILDVSSRERQSIGRDLHDGLGQELTGIALMLRSLATRFQHECVAGVAGINEVVGLVNQSIETARSLARGLLPVRTESGGLPFALRELAARSRDLYGLTVNFRAEIWPEITLSETSASHLYRIAQEALTNAARHGGAGKVDILLMANRNTFLLRITDDGVGIAMPHKPVGGMGLKIMRYRAGMIGAKIEIVAGDPTGTVVRVSGEQPSRQSGFQLSQRDLRRN